MDVIAHLPKAWTDSQRLRSPYYLEADSLLWATDAVKFYALSSPFPLYTYSDHMPLSWMKKSEKGPVSQFLIEHLSELETEHQYIQGHLNSVADAQRAGTPFLDQSDWLHVDWPILFKWCSPAYRNPSAV